jgi:hypothetical protein
MMDGDGNTSPSIETTGEGPSEPPGSEEYSGPRPLGDLDPEVYASRDEAEEATSFALPTVELPDGYAFERASVAASDDTEGGDEEYVALIYADRSDDSATEWAVLYVVHPGDETDYRIGENVSVGTRSGAYYEESDREHVLFSCNGSEYDLSGPFRRERLVRIARSICESN